MSGNSSPSSCTHCGRTVDAPTVDDTDQLFCSQGCQTVYETLDGELSGETTAESSDRELSDGDQLTDETERVFLDVDGMHSVTCETYLETVAERLDGVVEASASYVTETVRVTYETDALETESLADALSTLGYDAAVRALSDVDENRRNEIEELLGYRYIAGVVFGSFFLLPYIVVLYPAQLPSVFGPELALFADGQDASTVVLLLPFFVLVGGVVLVVTGLPLFRGAYASLVVRRPNTDLVVATTVLSAYLAGTLALVLGRVEMYYDLAIVVAAVVVGAVFYESLVKRRARERLTELTNSQVSTARRCHSEGMETVPVSDLSAGDHVLVRQGERIPVDGKLAQGACTVDESVVTGESLPRRKAAGESLVGGSVVTEHAAMVRVGDPPTSSIERLTTMVWDLQSTSHGRQRQADAVAGTLAPAVGLLAVAVTVFWFWRSGTVLPALLAGLTTLFVVSPWVLGFSTPLSVATSLRATLEEGIVVFDETLFERLRETDVVVFDKTGTLTTGEMTVVDTSGPDDLFRAVATLERYASHPVADAITEAFDPADRSVSSAPLASDSSTDVSDFRRHATGVQGTVDGAVVLAGTLSLFREQGWTVSPSVETAVQRAGEAGQLPIVAGRNGRAEGVLRLGDDRREGWETALSRLAERDLDIVVLTGDDSSATDPYRARSDVDHVFAGVPPEGKKATIERLQTDNHVTMVGDGTNDGPALAQADLAVALGSGTALASEAADLTIVHDDIRSIDVAFDLAERAGRRFRQNTVLALTYNAVTIPLALGGWLNPLFVMLVVVFSTGLVGLNANRSFSEK